MDRNSIYYRQVQLLMQVLPFVAAHDCFALKGGTAINLFVRDFPRLSVDIDLVFLPMMDRGEALQTITSHLEHGGRKVQIKIELSPVLRGTAYESNALSVKIRGATTCLSYEPKPKPPRIKQDNW